MDGFTTDGEYLKQGRDTLLDAADVFDQDAARFEDETLIPIGAFHNVPVPEFVNFSRTLADMIEGPYEDLRTAMLSTMMRTLEAVRENAAALEDAGAYYDRQDQETALWFNRWVE